jgi:hypothetical protein
VTSLDFVGGPGGSDASVAGGLGGLGQGGSSYPFSFSTALSGSSGSVFTLQDFVGSSGGPAAGLSPLDILQGANITGAGAADASSLPIHLPGFTPSSGNG